MVERRRFVLAVVSVCAVLLSAGAVAQEPASKPGEKPADAAAPPPTEQSSTTDHSLRIGAQTIPYRATAATVLLKNDKDEPEALLYYTAYTRSDIKDASERPLAFLYNGGPGSASLWLHMGAFGPKRVASVDVDGRPIPPFRTVDNADSLIDRADLVFIDPIGTGFSHAVGKSQDKDFWGVDQDVRSLAQFIQIYVSRNNRWTSPKFLIGESYGTFRSAVLGNYLQQTHSMALNGIVLISCTLDLGQLSFLPGDDLSYILYLPSYAATAWYHGVLKDRPADEQAFIEEARRFAAGEYATALMRGGRITEAEKSALAGKLSRFTGLSVDYLMKADLRVTLPQFMIELQRARGLTTGRIDARYTGPTFDILSQFAQSDPLMNAIAGAFAAAFNNYAREELKFIPGGDRQYNPLNGAAGATWDWKHQGAQTLGFPGAPNVQTDLAQALVANPRLRVEVENGLYDLATPFFATEYTMDHLGLAAKLRDNIRLNYYDAGHMMYVRDADRAKLKQSIAAFIESASK